MAQVSNIQPDFTELISLINEYALKFKELYKSKLEEDGRKATGTLINNVETIVKQGSNEYSVILQVSDYYQWIENGRKEGKFPPTDAILKWIRVKPILPHPDSKGKLPTEKQLAYLIGRAIARNGTIKDKGYDGGHYVQKTVDELNSEYLRKMQEALERDFDTYSMKVWSGINKMIKV